MPTATMIQARAPREDYTPQYFLRALPFIAFHVAAIVGAFYVHPTVGDLLLCASLYYLRMFGIAGGLHRYFSHRTYATSRAFQFLLAVLGCTAIQKGPLWWAANHRHHHRASDTPEDIHSPTQQGFWWSHVGWVMSPKYDATDFDAIPDFAIFPELRFLNKFFLIPPVLLAVGLFLVGGIHALVWGFGVSTVILWHGTFTINSLSHVFGRVRFPTTDTSRNSLSLALLTMGEGWHNNHHYYPGSMRQGFYWWQIDLAGYVIRALSWFGIVWDIRTAPERVLNLGLGKGGTPEARAESIAEAA